MRQRAQSVKQTNGIKICTPQVSPNWPVFGTRTIRTYVGRNTNHPDYIYEVLFIFIGQTWGHYLKSGPDRFSVNPYQFIIHDTTLQFDGSHTQRRWIQHKLNLIRSDYLFLQNCNCSRYVTIKTQHVTLPSRSCRLFVGAFRSSNSQQH